MSVDTNINGLLDLSNAVQTGIGTIQRTGADLGLGIPASGQFWQQTLRPASYRGIPFGVTDSEAKVGRRNAIHVYPNRDQVWVEDLGRQPRAFQVTGFLVGSDCIAQREKLIAAAEQLGDGELVHPTYGRLQVSLLDLSISERWNRGRVFDLEFSFIEAGQRIFPQVESATGDITDLAATQVDVTASLSFADRAAAVLKEGAAIATQAVSVAQIWGHLAAKAVADATNQRAEVAAAETSPDATDGAGGRSSAPLRERACQEPFSIGTRSRGSGRASWRASQRPQLGRRRRG